MLIFESTKTNTPIPRQYLASVLKSLLRTYVHNPGITTITETSKDDTQAYSNKSQHRYVVWNNAKSPLLTYQEETTQARRPIPGLSSLQRLMFCFSDIFLFLCVCVCVCVCVCSI